jgi:phytanoyl-CoA hydroxylase
MLTQQDVARYHEQGWIVVADVLDAATVKRARVVIDGLVAAAAGKTTHDDVYDLEPTHKPDAPRVRRIKKPHLLDPVFWEMVRSPKMLAILKQLIGSLNIRLHGSKLNIKAPRYGSPVEWHQDWAFFPHTNDDILAVGVMLDDVDKENGAMQVLPGTHKDRLVYDHHLDGRFCGAMDPAQCNLDFSKAVLATGKAGACSFHHVRLVHGSAQNTSNKPRHLMLFECTAADAWPLVNWTNIDEFNSRMVCGEPTLEPRMVAVPIRMPYPPALNQGSIYENQTIIKNRYFEMVGAS